VRALEHVDRIELQQAELRDELGDPGGARRPSRARPPEALRGERDPPGAGEAQLGGARARTRLMLVEALTGERTEREKGDEIRAAEKTLYFQFFEEVEPMDGERRLIERLRERGHTVVLASSAEADEVDHHLDLLDARELADAWTRSADVESTKPTPDLVSAAFERAGGSPEDAVMVGDTPWDVEAAGKARVSTLAVMTGGFAIVELEEAGAAAVSESVVELCERLDETPL
jgi:HAD superfamily hydrolase (TIGR01509 family)